MSAALFVGCDDGPSRTALNGRDAGGHHPPTSTADASVEGDAGASTPGADGGGGPSLVDAGALDPELGSLRRLNRTQYNNTVRDLLGTSLRPADEFPPDDLFYGFDTIGDALNVSTLLIEGYQKAAKDLIAELLATPSSDAYARFIVCDVATQKEACARRIFTQFASAAWRRPALRSEIDRYVSLYSLGATPSEGLQLGLQTILTSANFMFRLEFDPVVNDYAPHALSDYELASRLSYLLWGSIPDDALLLAAKNGDLQTDQGLSQQLERLLIDPKVSAFIADMAGLWLEGRKLGEVQRDPAVFPEWSDELRDAMRDETQFDLWEVFRQDLPVSELLTAKFTYVNQPLAQLYGINGISGAQLQQVDLSGNTERRGLLTSGTFLTVTSRPNRTAPVLRGKWVLDQLLCTPPPPPPPNVNPNLDSSEFEGLTLRQRMEKHRQAGTTCYACHAWMDPIGLGLENYDAIGQFRTSDEYGTIDASGELPDTPAQPFSGAFELGALIAQDSRYSSCVTQQIMTYGLGAKPSPEWINTILSKAAAGDGPTIKSIVRNLVMSAAFRKRRAAGAQP